MPELAARSDDYSQEPLLAGSRAFCAGVKWICATAALLIGLTNLAVWLVPAARVLAEIPGVMVVRVNTAIGIIACALALLIPTGAGVNKFRSRGAQWLALVAVAIGGLTSLEYLLDTPLGIDTLFAEATFPADRGHAYVVAPGRMSLNAALPLFSLGLALVGMDWRIGRKPGRRLYWAPTFALLAALPALSGLVGYVLNNGQFTGILRSTNILLHAAISLFGLSIGVLASRPGRPPMSYLLSAGADGVLLRWLLPGSTALLLVLAWVINAGRKSNIVAPGEGAALMLYGGLLLLLGLIIAASRAVARQERTAARAAAALVEQEQRGRAILETSLDAVILIDDYGRIMNWNPAAEQIFGWRRDEIVGQNLIELVIPEPACLDHRRALDRMRETGESNFLGGRLEITAQSRSGEEFPAEFSMNHLSGSENALYVVFVRDITDRKSAEQALRQSEQRFRTLADNISHLAWMTDQTGAVVWYNRRWFEYTGTTLKEMEGWGWRKVHHPDHLERVTAKFKAALERGENWEDLFPLRGIDGRYRWFLSRAMPIRDEAGNVLRWFGTNTDVTEQRELAEELARAKQTAEAASRAKDEFLATLSHELRTPLTPVLLSAASLRADERLPADLQTEMAMIERNVALEGRLIDDLLDLTRITRGYLPLRKEPCDVHAVIRHAIEIVREDMEEKEIGLTIALSAKLTVLIGDPARLQQVFWNLLKNAVKFTPLGGEITLQTCNSGEGDRRLVVAISDTGIGFDPETAERIFLPFEQGMTGDHRYGGLGLGLAIVRTVVDLHGGEVHAESSGPGAGSVFTVVLPEVKLLRGDLIPDERELISPNTPVRSLGILLVEDHVHTLNVLARLLRRAGHSVEPVNCIRDAIAQAEKRHFDLLISDLGLPDGTGFDLARALKKIDPGLHAIALSGYGMEKDI
ncbi:MAG: PAS domain S-box protein, partial [Chthoniobacteraceae bacterium]